MRVWWHFYSLLEYGNVRTLLPGINDVNSHRDLDWSDNQVEKLDVVNSTHRLLYTALHISHTSHHFDYN